MPTSVVIFGVFVAFICDLSSKKERKTFLYSGGENLQRFLFFISHLELKNCICLVM